MSNDRCETCKRPFKKERSTSQNKYYFGVVLKILSEYTGFTSDEMHEIIKHNFLKTIKIIDTKDGYKEFESSKSTRNLSTVEFENLMTDIRQWASIDLACYIPEPNEAPILE